MSSQEEPTTATARPAVVEVEPPTFEGVNDYFLDQAWGDGLPIVPPTPDRLQDFLAASGLDKDEQLGLFPPTWAPTSIEFAAINSLMAGSRPEYLRVVVAALEAILAPEFNLYGLQATTNPAGVMVIVNGPLASELDINSGYNVFGQGWRANATIGRAVRLCMINIGGGRPGVTDMTPLGNPNKYGSCIAENEAASPWEPLHVERSFERTDSAVSVVAATAPQNVIVMSTDGYAVLNGIAAALTSSGSNTTYFSSPVVIVTSPLHARYIANTGLTKKQARQYIWERSSAAISHLERTDSYAVMEWKRDCLVEVDGEPRLYVTASPDDIELVVAGGDVGGHSAIVATFNHTSVVTRRIRA